MRSAVQRSIQCVVLIGAIGTHGVLHGALSLLPAPQDLQLTSAEIAQARARAYFAWAFLQQIGGQIEQAEFLDLYRQALELAPDSRVILMHLVTPWLMEGKFASISEALTPVVAANPGLTAVPIVLSQALAAHGDADAARRVLVTALEQRGWRDHELLRELFHSAWREERYDDIEGYLRRARRFRRWRHFVVEQAAATYYHARAQLPDIRADDRATRRLEASALRHGREALRLAAQAERTQDVASLAGVFLDLEQWADAALLIETVRREAALSDTGLDLDLARALHELGRDAEAAAILRELGPPGALSPDLYMDVIQMHIALDDIVAAAAFCEGALAIMPRAMPIRFALAYLQMRLGDPARTLSLLEGLDRLHPEGYLLLSKAHRLNGDDEAAAVAVGKAEEAARTRHDDVFFSADFHLYVATLCEALGHIDRCIEHAEKAYALDPNDPVSANFLGYVLADHNRELDRAEALIVHALTKEPDNFAYLDSLAWVYYRQERHALALIEINKALRHAPAAPDPVVMDHAGDIYAANGLWLLAPLYWHQALAAGSETAELIRRKIAATPTPLGAVDR